MYFMEERPIECHGFDIVMVGWVESFLGNVAVNIHGQMSVEKQLIKVHVLFYYINTKSFL